jgi:hypothetical protein
LVQWREILSFTTGRYLIHVADTLIALKK